MTRSSLIRRLLAVVIACVAVAPVHAQLPPSRYKNLKVLPQDIAPQDLQSTMGTFTRGLGVRCSYCHVNEDFSSDEKPTKRKARVMMQMVKDVNEKYLSALESRSEPPVAVQCMTCHRGVTQPRMLQDVLATAYDTGGMDSTKSRYTALRDRYYGRAAYDFGEVPLADVAHHVQSAGHADDAVQLWEYNVEMNPKSTFAKRQHAEGSIAMAYQQAGVDSGAARYRAFQQQYGPSVVSEELMNQVGYDLMGSKQTDRAVAAFKLNATEHPASGNAYDSLGEAYLEQGDLKQAKQAYAKSLELDPTNENAKRMLAEIDARAKTTKGSKKSGKSGNK